MEDAEEDIGLGEYFEGKVYVWLNGHISLNLNCLHRI